MNILKIAAILIYDNSHKVTVHKTDFYIESQNRETFEAKSYLC